MEEINKIAKKLNIPENYINMYGKYKAKIDFNYINKIKEKKNGKLILVTSINPTPFGEGKTTQSIGISMAMNKIDKKTLVVLREPSLGPVFGIKGGAIGGGKSTVEPSEDINLHFTGDFHAISSANNLLCAIIDNHIYQDNKLGIDKNRILIKRVVDMNDRSLRNINIGVGEKTNGIERNTGFEITSACELMAICDLCENMQDLKNRIDNMLIAYTNSGEPVYVRELNCTNAMIALLRDVINPNLVQTVENTPCIIHLGPFANIAHGCNSLIATKMALKLSDYVVTEAGFGADLGAEKFFDIKCRIGNLKPDIAVIVATIKAIKYNAGVEVNLLEEENIEAIKKGICNLEKHIENVKKYNIPTVVCINKFDTDTENEINVVKQYLEEIDVKCEVSTAFENGSNGAIEVAKLICNALESSSSNFNMLYNDDKDIKSKIEIISKEIYGASGVNYSDKSLKNIADIESLGYSNLPVCIAKTPSSLSDNPKLLGRPTDFKINVKDVKLNSGAGFVVVYSGNIMTMPGLGKKSKYEEF